MVGKVWKVGNSEYKTDPRELTIIYLLAQRYKFLKTAKKYFDKLSDVPKASKSTQLYIPQHKNYVKIKGSLIFYAEKKDTKDEM